MGGRCEACVDPCFDHVWRHDGTWWQRGRCGGWNRHAPTEDLVEVADQICVGETAWRLSTRLDEPVGRDANCRPTAACACAERRSSGPRERSDEAPCVDLNPLRIGSSNDER